MKGFKALSKLQGGKLLSGTNMTTKILNLEDQDPNFALELDRTFHECREKYNSMVGDISYKFVGNLYWGLGSIASRNKYYSPLIGRCLKLFLVRSRLDAGLIPDIIQTNDAVLCALLKKNFSRPFPSIKFECSEVALVRFWRVTRPLRQFIISTGFLILRFFASKSPLSQVEAIKQECRPITLIDTFVLNNQGDEGGIINGLYRDRYYPGLRDNLTDFQSQTLWLVPTTVGFYNFSLIYEKIRTATPKMLLIDDFLKWSDYLFALTFPFQYLFCRVSSVMFDGVDITKLLRDEQVNKCSDYMSIQSLLHYRFAKRLQGWGIPVASYIDWNENQTIDKAMIKGFRDYYKNIRIVGYQGYIISRGLHLYCFPTEYEVLSGFSPDTMFVIGPALVADMKQFTGSIDVQVAPAFRFQNVWRAPKFQQNINGFEILIGLPISAVEARHIFRMVRDATKNFSPEYGRIRVKPHPTYSVDAIQSLLEQKDFSNIEFVTGDFHDSIENVNLLISNSSSVCLEALAKGVPVIVVGSKTGVTQNPIPNDVASEMWCVAHDAKGLSRAVTRYKDTKQMNRELFYAVGNQIREDYFSLISAESVCRFVFGEASKT